MRRLAIACLLLIGPPACATPARAQAPTQAQGTPDIRELKLRDWAPRPMIVTQATTIARPAVPVFDVHNHLGGGAAALSPKRVKQLLDELDAAGVKTVVNLDGGWGQRLRETLAALDEAHPGRFVT